MYGVTTLQEVRERIDSLAVRLGSSAEHIVSNSQGVLIDAINRCARPDGVIVNPGGLTNVGIALRDRIEDLQVATAVVHVTNAAKRELWRQHDVFADIADVYIAGAGAHGYVLAVEALHVLADQV
jgi:3-dehydroquinate dehydratase-2